MIKQKQINAVESIGNQNNQIRPCRLCLQFNGLRFSTSTPTTQCIQLFDSKFPAVFHCQKVTDHSPCLPHFLLLNAESKSSSRTDEIQHYDCHVKFENNTLGRARLWDTALKFLCPGLSITSPGHLGVRKVQNIFHANFFMFMLLISNHTVFLVQFGINLHL